MGRRTRHLPAGSKPPPFPRLVDGTSAVLEKEAEGVRSNQPLIHDPVVVTALAAWQVAVVMMVVPGIVHMPGIHIMPARLISPHRRRSWRRVYRAGRECLCPGLCRHCSPVDDCAGRYTEHRGRSCCNHMLAHFQPPDVSFDDELSISNTAHHNQGGNGASLAGPLIQRYRQGASFRHSRVRRLYPPGGRIHRCGPSLFQAVNRQGPRAARHLARAHARVFVPNRTQSRIFEKCPERKGCPDARRPH